jgi:hypothetical protein
MACVLEALRRRLDSQCSIRDVPPHAWIGSVLWGRGLGNIEWLTPAHARMSILEWIGDSYPYGAQPTPFFEEMRDAWPTSEVLSMH